MPFCYNLFLAIFPLIIYSLSRLLPHSVTWQTKLWEISYERALKKKKGDPQLKRWDIVTLLKEKGGLGVDKIKISTTTLLSKWIWRYFTEKDSLWRVFSDAKYRPSQPDTIPNTCKYTSSKSPWFHIGKLQGQMLDNLFWKINSGEVGFILVPLLDA